MKHIFSVGLLAMAMSPLMLPGQEPSAADCVTGAAAGPGCGVVPDTTPVGRLPQANRTAALAAQRASMLLLRERNGVDPAPPSLLPPAGPEARDLVSGDPPTEFQRFASASTGAALPVYASELFRGTAATFAPLERQTVTADYVIGPGDELLLRVWGQVNLSLELTVDRTGAVYVPQAGSVIVSGVAYRDLPDFMRAHLARVFRNFDLSVTMGQLRAIQVFVVGQARRPGSYTVSSMSTLVNAIFACGGPSAQGSMRRIALKRDNTVISEFDLYRLVLEGDKSADRKLSAGDVIYFPTAGPQIAIAGSVRSPAVFELKGAESLADVLAMAGGFTPVADRQVAKIERVRQGTRVVDELALDADGLATPVLSGDVIRFPSVAPQFDQEVTLRGNVANPGRFRWWPGMRLADVIPSKESLTTRAYWERHNALGFTATLAKLPQAREENTEIQSIGPDINWSYAVIERRNSRDLSRQLVPFHLGKLVLEHDPAQNLDLQPSDVITVLTQQDLRVPVSQQNRFVRLEGEFKAPGIYEARPGETLGQLIERTGGFSKDAYLYGAEFTRESVRHDQQERLDQAIRDIERDTLAEGVHPQSLVSTEEPSARTEASGRIIERLRSLRASGRIALASAGAEGVPMEKLLAVPLEDGDRFVAPARPITVGVLGDVYNPGALLHDSRLRVQDYLRLAGGCTRSGDRSRIFLIRADGTVVSKQSFGRFGPSFEMQPVRPGDTIVAPQAMPRHSLIRGVRDWSQAMAQFGLGAAAINVLR